MADIFLSYNRDDQAVARRFADGFEKHGFTVWWDATLRSGEAYDQVTEQALEGARAVVVLWSPRSVDSRWVRAEATLAERQKTLVPAMIEPCKRPIMFELTQTADLSQWDGDPQDAAWLGFVDVRRFVRHNDVESTTTRTRIVPMIPPPSHFNARTLGIAAAVLVVAGALAWFIAGRNEGSTSSVAAPAAQSGAPVVTSAALSVAVVPFVNLTGQADKEYFSDGMAEELINALTMVPGLDVASRTSSFAYKGKNTDIRQIARDLNVSTILEGSVRSAEQRIRVTAQLINAQTGYHFWSQTFDRDYKDLFVVQEDLAREIVKAFKTTMKVDLPEFQGQEQPTQDLEAYALFLKAQSSIDFGVGGDAASAIPLLEEAIARDPQFARAYVLLALAKSLDARTPLRELEALTDKVQALVPDYSGIAAQRASVRARRGDWSQAEQLLQDELARSKDPALRMNYALNVLWSTGQLRKAIENAQVAQRGAPGQAAYASNLSRMLLAAGGEDAAARQYSEIALTLGADPRNRRLQQGFLELERRAGQYDKAAERFRLILSPTLRALGAADTVQLVYAALADAAKRRAAIASLDELTRKAAPDDWVIQVWSMDWFTSMGAVDKAYEAGERMRRQFAEQAPVNAWSWLWSPEMAPFRRDQRFAAFTTRIGLMKYWQQRVPPDACTLAGDKLTCS